MILLPLLLILSSMITCQSFLRISKLVNKPIARLRSTELYGIPKLFRWLIDLYPIVLDSVRNGLTSPNAMKIDNFYLDMNGIIHSCTHSNNDKLVEFNEIQMFNRIFTYTDNLYKLVKPSKLMFLAVDGVAPRAKMNQQRSRRFRSSKEREILIAEYVAKEGKLPDQESFDSNCITPGTQFMHRLGVAFRSWIQYKMKTDEFWIANGATVVFSGPDVPGEGEHKVMDMIRSLQSDTSTGYQIGSLRHCMYGLDADLIMLSLATHEPHFVLLREKIYRRKNKLSGKSFSSEDFELLEITLLRAMLRQHFRKLQKIQSRPLQALSYEQVKAAEAEVEAAAAATGTSAAGNLEPKKLGAGNQVWKKAEGGTILSSGSSSAAEIEHENRVIDDFIFLCFFIGNDFLPSLPHLDISDGSLTFMMDIYRDMIPHIGGYLTNGNQLHLARIELFIQEISRREVLYFQHRAIIDKEAEYNTPRYKEHYYKTKFGIEADDLASRRKIVEAYVHGLAWVLTYYKDGCGSWTWYYPYLYAPLASDIIDICSMELSFEQGVPFTPLLQLLSVLPPQSGKFLPSSYEQAMIGASSPLYEYYPKDFEVDANGKKNAWECVVKIPFINETTLVETISSIDHERVLTEEEKQRNIRGSEYRHTPTAGGKKTAVMSPQQQQQQAEQEHQRLLRHQSKERTERWGNALIDELSHMNHRNPSASSSSPTPTRVYQPWKK
jgi:5'-3' exoribonuclease 4